MLIKPATFATTDRNFYSDRRGFMEASLNSPNERLQRSLHSVETTLRRLQLSSGRTGSDRCRSGC